MSAADHRVHIRALVRKFQLHAALQRREICSVPCRFPCVLSIFFVFTPMRPRTRPDSVVYVSPSAPSGQSQSVIFVRSTSVIKGVIIRIFLRPWSKRTANSDKKLNVNKPCMTSRKNSLSPAKTAPCRNLHCVHSAMQIFEILYKISFEIF